MFASVTHGNFQHTRILLGPGRYSLFYHVFENDVHTLSNVYIQTKHARIHAHGAPNLKSGGEFYANPMPC